MPFLVLPYGVINRVAIREDVLHDVSNEQLSVMRDEKRLRKHIVLRSKRMFVQLTVLVYHDQIDSVFGTLLYLGDVLFDLVSVPEPGSRFQPQLQLGDIHIYLATEVGAMAVVYLVVGEEQFRSEEEHLLGERSSSCLASAAAVAAAGAIADSSFPLMSVFALPMDDFRSPWRFFPWIQPLVLLPVPLFQKLWVFSGKALFGEYLVVTAIRAATPFYAVPDALSCAILAVTDRATALLLHFFPNPIRLTSEEIQ